MSFPPVQITLEGRVYHRSDQLNNVEALKIQEVKPLYTENGEFLDLRVYGIPKTKLRPGMIIEVRLLNGGK